MTLTILSTLCYRTTSTFVQQQYSGVVNTKAVGIEAAKSGKGIVLTTKNSKKAPSAIKATKSATTIKKGGGRRATGVISNVVAKKGYRADLTKGRFPSSFTNIVCSILGKDSWTTRPD